jgi:ABC-2 type transport system ATP-binding protein
MTPRDAGPAVEVDGLSRNFGRIAAVADLRFQVGRGELFGLVGPDGAGKTTTLRLLAGILRPTRGDARILGASVARDPEQVKHRIAYMSQRFGLYGDLTIMENIRFYADLYLVPESELPARLDRLFGFSRLGPFKDRLAAKLSGGMKQKLGLCCALVHQPEVLLLDEPTFGVDPISRRDLWVIVHEMVASGMTAIVSTSYMDEAERFDRLALMNNGRILTVDDPQTLQAGVEGEMLAVRVDRSRDARSILRALSGVRAVSAFGDHLHVTVDDAASASPLIEAILERSGNPARSIEKVAPSMEDVFLQRLGAEGT